MTLKYEVTEEDIELVMRELWNRAYHPRPTMKPPHSLNSDEGWAYVKNNVHPEVAVRLRVKAEQEIADGVWEEFLDDYHLSPEVRLARDVHRLVAELTRPLYVYRMACAQLGTGREDLRPLEGSARKRVANAAKEIDEIVRRYAQ